MAQNNHHGPPDEDAAVAQAVGDVAADPGEDDVGDRVDGVEEVEDVRVLVVGEAQVLLEGLVQSGRVVIGVVVTKEDQAARGEDRPAHAADSNG